MLTILSGGNIPDFPAESKGTPATGDMQTPATDDAQTEEQLKVMHI